MFSRRKRIGLAIGLLLLPTLAGAGVYLCVPSLRLPADAKQLHTLSNLQRVDAHRYDAEWFDAARAGRVDILSALHDANYPINAQTHAGYTALILAAYDEQPDALEYLLQAGADACLGDHNGNTALMGALYKGELAIAQRLLKTSCHIDQTNNAGETALSFAALFGRLEILPRLIAQGADPNHMDAHGDSALAIAIKQNNPESAAALRKVGATR